MAKWTDFFGGFKLTLRHIGRPTVTNSYPKVKRPKQPRQHGRHVLNRYEDGMEKCIGCELCAGVCPANCINVRGLDNPIDHPVSPGERYGYTTKLTIYAAFTVISVLKRARRRQSLNQKCSSSRSPIVQTLFIPRENCSSMTKVSRSVFRGKTGVVANQT